MYTQIENALLHFCSSMSYLSKVLSYFTMIYLVKWQEVRCFHRLVNNSHFAYLSLAIKIEPNRNIGLAEAKPVLEPVIVVWRERPFRRRGS